MAKKVVWTLQALQDRVNIYRFWLANNKSETYSKEIRGTLQDNRQSPSSLSGIRNSNQQRKGTDKSDKDLQGVLHSKTGKHRNSSRL
jgi:hypothetical protein